jgi:hypothetical protein
VAEQSWLGNIWDEITGRSKKPGIEPTGLLSGTITPEYTPLASEIGLLSRNIRAVDLPVMGEHLKRNIPAVVASVPGAAVDVFNLPTAAREYAVRQFRGEPTDNVEFFPASTQSYDLARQGMIGVMGEAPPFPNPQTEAATTLMEMVAPIPGSAAPRALQTTRNVANRAAEAVERSPLGQNILAMQEQRGMPMSQMMAGERAATANLEKLDEAKSLMKEGEEPKNIWEKTGWAMGEDGKWRFEIDDSASALSGGQERFDNLLFSRYQQLVREGIKKSDEPVYLEDVFYHPDLYAAYPQLKRAEIEVFPETERTKGKRGGNVIGIRADLGQGEAREVKLHEIQHLIQEIEGFSPGGSWRQFYQDPQELVAKYQARINELEDLIPEQYGKPGWSELVREREDLMNRQNAAKRMTPEMAQNKAELEYWKMFGEAEARQTSARADMTAEQRAKMFPYKPEDFYWQTGVGLDETSISPPRTTGIFGQESYEPKSLLGKQPSQLGERPANAPEGQALQFLHNTSAEKLLRQERMGGMPMPSVGVTREDVPFESFGDITLVGRKEAFDPRTTRTNEIFSADAYTVRAPRPIRLANKDAYSRLKEEFGDVADRLGDSIMSEQYELEALSRKGSSTESAYDNVVRFFEYDYVPRIKFLEEKGIEIPLNKDGKIDRWAADDIVNQDFREEFFEWANNKKDEYLTGQELFITNPDRDYVLQKPRYAEYTADNVTNYMKKRSGRGKEGGMGSTGVGAQRAATTEQLSSMKAMQERRGEFVPRDEVERLREQQEQNFFDLTDELRKFYKYDANSFSYLDEVSEMITISERKGLSSALKEVGFKDVSPEVIEKINQYKDSLRSSPVQYFEAKPKRTVQLDEFAGAIVPENTPQSVIDMLEAKGIKVEKYKNEEERLKLRSKFPSTMFSAAPTIPGLLADQEDKGENRPMRSLMDF